MNNLIGRYTSVLTITSIVLGLGTMCYASTEPATSPISRVFTETNGVTGNSVLVYTRAVDGSLTLTQTVPTGQNGTGGFLEAQGALLVLSHFVLAINAGSNSITVLNIGSPTVKVVGSVNSGGTLPKSLTNFKDTVYVLNQGAAGNISGFTFSSTTGTLTPIAGSTQPLSGMTDPQPAQIGFSINGKSLMVTEKNTNVIDVYGVNAAGVASAPTVYSAHAPNPYGFASGLLSRFYVTEANGAVSLGSSVSSYSLSAQHVPQLISASVGTGQSAACWAVLNTANTFLYVTNNESNAISVMSVDSAGHVTNLPALTVTTPGNPYDLAISPDGKNIYVVYLGGLGTIITYTVNSDGSLTAGPSVTGIGNAASGLVVR